MSLSIIIFLQYLLVTTDGLTSGIMIEFASGGVKEHNQPVERLKRILSFWMLELILMIPKMITGAAMTTTYGQLLQAAGYILLVHHQYRLKWLKSAGWYIAYIITACCAELLYMSANPQVLAQTYNWTREYVIPWLIPTEILVILFKFLFARLVMIKNTSGWKDPYFVFYLLYGLAIILVYPILSQSELSHQTVLIRAHLPLFLMLCIFIVIYGVERWKHARFRLNIESSNNQELLQKTALGDTDEKLAKISHDAGTIEQTIRLLIEQEQKSEAMEMIQKLSSEISSEISSESAAED